MIERGIVFDGIFGNVIWFLNNFEMIFFFCFWFLWFNFLLVLKSFNVVGNLNKWFIVFDFGEFN